MRQLEIIDQCTTIGTAAARNHAHTQEKSLNELTAVLYTEATLPWSRDDFFIDIGTYVCISRCK